MKNRSCAFVFATLFATCALTFAQSGPAGTWRVEGVGAPFPWEAVLRADGSSRLIGAVSSCSSARRAFEIFEGKIAGNTIAFKCKSGDGQRTLTLTGRINGDEIAFAWALQVQEGGSPGDPADGIFGPSAPRQFTAKRASDATDAVAELADHARRDPNVSFDRIRHSDQEPQNWLTYSGTLLGHRFSPLTQITPSNVKNLELAWIWQAQSQARFEATALVVDGVLYTVQAPNDVVALNAATGRVLWTYRYKPLPRARASGGGGSPNRGLAILGDTLFMGTLDAHLLAIDALTGNLIWNTTVADAADPVCQRLCYVITHAPLVVKDKVIVGVGGGEGPIRGFIAAFDVKTGKEVWRFYTVPAAGEPGSETWSGDSWKTGGAGVWNTGAYDPDLNLTYWGTGNPYPTWIGNEAKGGSARLGDNLYSDSVVALDADTGKLKWYYQFTPHDNMDWDATEIPVLTDIDWQGTRRKVMLMANRNGIMYVLDRTTGQFLLGKPFVEVNWMTGFDEKGRPIQVPGLFVNSEKTVIHPANGTNWMPPSYSPSTGLFYVPSWEREAVGGLMQRPSPSYGAMRAFDPRTGEKKWEFKKNDAMFYAGALTTASDLLFTGTSGDYYSGDAASRLTDGYFYALNARTGELLWQMALAGSVQSGPMSYSVAGKQYIAVAAGNTLFVFALRQ
jgi:alcohol dehydrogenase (cytochrome c)